MVGDLLAGWTAPRWGVVAAGSAHTFALDRGETLSDLDAYRGHVEGWLRFGDERAAFELRGRFGASLYDTTFIQAPAGTVAFRDETSATYDGTLLVGAHLRAAERFVVDGLVGGGVYREEYNATRLDAGAGAKTDGGIVDTSRLAGRAEGRVQLRWLAMPQALSLRLRSEARLSSLTRSADVIAILGAKVAATSTTDTSQQLETSSRFFVQADALAVADIVPTLFVGLDTLSVAAAGASKTDVVPVVGVGLFKSQL